MSEENVEVIRRVFKEFTIEQKPPAGSLGPDFVWDMSAFHGWPGETTYHGPNGFMDFFRDWVGAYEEWTQDLERVIDAGGERVVAMTKQRGRLRGATTWVEMRYGIVYAVKGGQIQRAEAYSDQKEALEAVGLSQ
jgi:ketosteroid isomerase-like protein